MSLKKVITSIAFIVFASSCSTNENIRVCEKVLQVSQTAICAEFVSSTCNKLIECSNVDRTEYRQTCLSSGLEMCTIGNLFRYNVVQRFYNKCIPAVDNQKCEELGKSFPLECELLFVDENPDTI